MWRSTAPHMHFYALRQYEVLRIANKKPASEEAGRERAPRGTQSSLLRETPPRISSTWSKLPSEATNAAT